MLEKGKPPLFATVVSTISGQVLESFEIKTSQEFHDFLEQHTKKYTTKSLVAVHFQSENKDLLQSIRMLTTLGMVAQRLLRIEQDIEKGEKEGDPS